MKKRETTEEFINRLNALPELDITDPKVRAELRKKRENCSEGGKHNWELIRDQGSKGLMTLVGSTKSFKCKKCGDSKFDI